jgi:hypothetical protein
MWGGEVIEAFQMNITMKTAFLLGAFFDISCSCGCAEEDSYHLGCDSVMATSY